MSKPIQSVERAFAILRSFTEQTPELGVTELSRRLCLHKSTVSRFLTTLQNEGLVNQNPQTGKYRLGQGLISLAGVALGQIDIRGLAQPHLPRLLAEVQETITIEILDGREAVSVERLASPRALRYVGWIGRRTPLHCTASGLVFLAWMGDEARQGLLPEPLPRFTAATLTDPTALERRLAEVRERGYAEVAEEFEPELSSLAAPLCDHAGQVIAAIEISGPSTRMDRDTIKLFAQHLLEATTAISADAALPVPQSALLISSS